eukprot:Gb_03632 [translate_table: standard]
MLCESNDSGIFAGADLYEGNILYLFLQDLLLQFRSIARAGKYLKLSVCLDILDIMYESEDLNVTFLSADVLAAAILSVAYVLTIPKGRSEFPLLPWLKLVTNCEDKDVRVLAERILMHILQCQTLLTESTIVNEVEITQLSCLVERLTSAPITGK